MNRREPLQTATIAAIVVAVLAVSSSAPIIAFAAAPALAIAFWRNAAASVVLWPVAATRRRDELAGLAGTKGRSALIGCVLAGCALAAHFATWVPSVKLTSVADAVALCAIQPVWQGLIALRPGPASAAGDVGRRRASRWPVRSSRPAPTSRCRIGR